MPVVIQAVDHPELPPLKLSDRFRHDVTYFATPASDLGRVPFPQGEYFVRLADSRSALDDGVFRIVSPLDSSNRTELEITEEQEVWLEWMVSHAVEHIRVSSTAR